MVKEVLLLRSKLWAISDVTTRTVEGTHIRSPIQTTGKRAQRNTDGTWVTPADGEVLRESGIQTLST